MTRPEHPEQWAALLRHLAGPVPAPGAPLGVGRIGGVLLAFLHGAESTAELGCSVDARGEPWRPEERIWAAVHDGDRTLDALLLGNPDRGERLGPLLPPPIETGDLPWRDESAAAWASWGWPVERWTIETWTEAELSSMQALLHRVAQHGRPQEQARLRARLAAARAWHLENTQPDNATNRPWAIPVFLADLQPVESRSEPHAAALDATAAAERRLYAESLLHNCLAQGAIGGGGTARDPLDAAILHHAAILIVALASSPVARTGSATRSRLGSIASPKCHDRPA